MKLSNVVWMVFAAGILLAQAGAGRAGAAGTSRLLAEWSRYQPEIWRFEETPAQREDLARRFGFFRALDDRGMATQTCIPWAKPLAGGTMRVLFLQSWFAGRDVLELAQRLDLKYTHVALLRENEWPPLGRTGANLFEPLETRLVESLKGNESVIAFGSSPCAWPDLRAPTRQAILDAVKAGKGLVYCGDPAPLANDLGKEFIADAPAAKALEGRVAADPRGASVRAGAFGKGRVVLIALPPAAAKNAPPAAPAIGPAALNEAGRDAARSLLAASLVWASRRESGVSVALHGAGNLSWKSEDPVSHAISAETDGPGVEWLDWHVQSAGGESVASGTQHFPAPKAEAAVSVIHLPGGRSEEHVVARKAEVAFSVLHLHAGRYVVHAVVRDAGRGALAWTSAPLTVTCDSKLEVQFDKPNYAPRDSAAVAVAVTKAAPRGLSLRCSLTDGFGRLIATELRPAAASAGVEKMLFTFPLGLAVAKGVVARATLFAGDTALLDSEAATVILRSEARPGFFEEAAGPVGDADMAAHLVPAGFRRSPMPELDLDRAAALEELVRKPCLSDPVYLARSQGWVREQARRMALTGDLGLIVADGWNFAGPGAEIANLCHCASCERAMRDFLRAEYRAIDRLNSAWGARFTDWDKVVSPTWEQARESGRFSAWIDKRRSEESAIADYFNKCAAAGKEVYPGFRLVLAGAPIPSEIGGYDWRRLMNAVDAVSLSDGPQVQLARSFARPSQILMRSAAEAWDEADAGQGARQIWQALFSGLDGVCASAPDGGSSLRWPDSSLRPYGRAVTQAVRAVQAGPADLIAAARREDDGIAILYSQASLHAAASEGFRGRPVSDRTYVDTLAGFEALLGDLGFQFRYIADDEIAAGELQKRGCRLVVIPFSEAISPQAIESIRRFAAAGGTVLADLCPGVSDQHGKTYDSSLMDDLLGVKKKRHRPLFRSGKLTVRPPEGQRLPEVAFDAFLGEPNLALSGAVAWGSFEGEHETQAPAAMFYSVGSGFSLLLNFGLCDYAPPRRDAASAERARAVQRLTRALLAQARIEPVFAVSGASAARFRSGEAVYLGLSAPTGESEKIHVAMGGADAPNRCVYDVRSQKFVGRLQNFDCRMRDAGGELIALMPREIGQVWLRGPKRLDRGQIARLDLSLSTWQADMGRAVIRVEVYDPEGNLNAAYTQNITCDGGNGVARIPFALNDAAGAWRVRAVEVVSGHSDEARVEVF